MCNVKYLFESPDKAQKKLSYLDKEGRERGDYRERLCSEVALLYTFVMSIHLLSLVLTADLYTGENPPMDRRISY